MEPSISLSKSEITTIFDEWAKRCSKGDIVFTPAVDKNGCVDPMYGKTSADYFETIAEDLNFI